MYYPYNALFGRGSQNAFEVEISYSYLCMKMPAINGVITVHGDQTEARNIKEESTLGQKNVHAISERRRGERRNRKCEATNKSTSLRRDKESTSQPISSRKASDHRGMTFSRRRQTHGISKK
jgi:hypothetical protein